MHCSMPSFGHTSLRSLHISCQQHSCTYIHTHAHTDRDFNKPWIRADQLVSEVTPTYLSPPPLFFLVREAALRPFLSPGSQLYTILRGRIGFGPCFDVITLATRPSRERDQQTIILFQSIREFPSLLPAWPLSMAKGAVPSPIMK